MSHIASIPAEELKPGYKIQNIISDHPFAFYSDGYSSNGLDRQSGRKVPDFAIEFFGDTRPLLVISLSYV